MLIEELFRLGRPLVEGGMNADEMLRLITDVAEARVRNFYRHVFVVELPPEGASTPPRALPMQCWGNELEGVFVVALPRALGAPITIPSGGNPTSAQGQYGLPAWPCYDRGFAAFRQSAEEVVDFLRKRLARTLNFRVSEPELVLVAQQLRQAVVAVPPAEREQWLGVVVLVRTGALYTYRTGRWANATGDSVLQPGQQIVPEPAPILAAVWQARVREGAEEGHRAGACSFTGEGEEVVSPYCTAWPWAFLTWTCPVPQAGNTVLVVEGIGLSAASYRALTAGACVFKRLTKFVHSFVVPEVFAPANNRAGRNRTNERNLTDLPRLYGSSFLLPVQDRTLASVEMREAFVAGLRHMLAPRPTDGPLTDRYLDSVAGFDVLLPEDLDNDDFRLTLVYFSGDPGRGDIKLRACIQDVIPSTARRLRSFARVTANEAVGLLSLLHKHPSEKMRAYVRSCYLSVPYLLARGYGGAHLWTQLETVLHRRRLDQRPLTAGAASRLASLVPRWPHSRSDIKDEVMFYLCVRSFASACNRQLTHSQAEDMPMRDWKQLLKVVEAEPLAALRYESVAELGFGCGALVRRFAGWYWKATQAGKEGKDYLKHRVLTFGADLSPEVVWRIGLGKLFDVAKRFETPHRKLSRDFQRRVGATLTEFERLQGEVRKQRDDFMTAFWAGYALWGYDRPSKPKSETQPQQTGAPV